MDNIGRKKNADRILYECGLLKRLRQIGAVHIVGSYRMDMMAWNDLDIDIENDSMSREALYDLSAFITSAFHPVWYEAKEETDDDGKKVWFHGFETIVDGELWNVDLWFLDKKTISDVEKYCDDIAAKASQEQRDIIVKIKCELIFRGLYSFEQYRSVDVYKAVLGASVKSTDEFLSLFESGRL